MDMHELTLPIDAVTRLRMPPAEFQAKYRAYQAARDAHKNTVNTPAPFPEHEVFRVAYDRNEDIDVVPADPFEAHRQERGRNVVAEFDSIVAELRQKGVIANRP
jgi:hypothetical protein